MSDRDTCVSVYLSVGIHTFSLLPDVTALANHLAAFIPLAAFDLLLMPWMFSSNVCWPSALENSSREQGCLSNSMEANLGDFPPLAPVVSRQSLGRLRARLQSVPAPGRGWMRRDERDKQSCALHNPAGQG